MGATVQFTSWVENTNNELMYPQSIKSVKQNAAKSVNRSTERSRHIGFGVIIVHSSMGLPKARLRSQDLRLIQQISRRCTSFSPFFSLKGTVSSDKWFLNIYQKMSYFLYLCYFVCTSVWSLQLLSSRGVEGGLPSSNSQGLSQPPFPLHVCRILSP